MFNISEFQQEILDNGVLRSNRYLVTFNPPKYLSNENTKYLSLRCESAQIPGMTFATVDGPPRFGYGPIESNPYGVIYDDVTLNFILDSKTDVYNFFYKWSNSIVNYQSIGQSALKDSGGPVKGMKTWEVGYKDSYVTDITISIYDGSGTVDQLDAGNKVMEVTLYRAFPKNLPTFDMNWEGNNDIVKLPVQFNYTDFTMKQIRNKV